MSFFAILLALVLEQARPMTAESPIYKTMAGWADWVARTLDAGVRHQAWVAWGITVLLPAVVVMLVHWMLVLSLVALKEWVGWYNSQAASERQLVAA